MLQFRRLLSILSLKFLLFLGLTNLGYSQDYVSYSAAIAAMTKLLKIELWLTATVDNALQKSKTDFNVVNSFIKSVDKEHEKSYEDPEEYLSNPLKSFTLLRRAYEDWPIILNLLEKPIKEDIEKQLEENEMYLPVSEDMNDAILGMNRIRRTYNLRAMDIAEGRLSGIKYDGRLSFVDLYAIGHELFKLEKYADAAVWLNASLHTDYQGPTPKEIYNCDRKIARTLYLDTLKHLEKTSEEILNKTDFETTCGGEGMRLTNNLSCRYNTTSNYFHILAPQKMEELSIDPYIVIFHDALTNAEMHYLKYSKPELKRAKVINADNEFVYNSDRITHSLKMTPKKSIVQKLQAITGFDEEGFEKTVILNYGLGGHYAFHGDFFLTLKAQELAMQGFGNRIATIFIYLSDVEQGGATVFPLVGLSIKPQKGSLVLWYNLKNNGNIDKNTIHAACPVIVGSKWASVTVVRERPQFRAMPCFNA